MRFEWDEGNAGADFGKQGVSFHEAATVFDDSLAWTYPDPAHSDSEQRWITMGFSGEQRLIVVAHTDRNDKVRLISARQATRKEQRFYEEG